MEMRRPRMSPPSTRSRYIAFDPDGNPIVELDFLDEKTVVQEGGTVLQTRSSRSLGLSDGYNVPPQALMSRRGVFMATCAECPNPSFHGLRREQPSHGLILARNARKCQGCGRVFCSRHVAQGGDGKWRCRSCARKSGFWRLVRWVFFRD